MSETKIYTENDLKIALLEQSNTGILESLRRLEANIDNFESKLDSKIDNHFHWTMGSISVLYISLIGTLVTALAKSLHWF